MVIDCDEANSEPLTADHLQCAMAFLAEDETRAGVFANQEGVYVDMWPLRHPAYCPDDPWEAVIDHAIARRAPYQAAFDATYGRRVPLVIPTDAPPIPVESAFGGLGVYKIASVLRNERPYAGYKLKTGPSRDGPREHGWQVCELVAFNLGFGEIGQSLHILPWLVNRRMPDLSFPADAVLSLIFNPATTGPDDGRV